MFDINKAIMDESLIHDDPEGYMADLPEWSEGKAMELARLEGLELTSEHWKIIHFLRDRYRMHGPHGNAREILHEMEANFAHHGNKREFYQLFPGGPVTQGSRIAGLPLPAYSADKSFGSVH